MRFAENLLMAFLVYASMVLPYAAGCYTSFWSKLKISPRRLIVILAFVFLIQMFVMGFIPMSQSLSDIVFYIICISNFFILKRTIAASASQILFVYLSFMQIASIIRGVSFFLEIRIFLHSDMTTIANPIETLFLCLIELGLAFLLTSLFAVFIKKYFIPLFSSVQLKQWRMLLLIPLIFIVIIITVTVFMRDFLGNLYYLFLLLTIAVGSIAAYFVIFFMMREIVENSCLREENLTLAFREQYYEILSKRIEQEKRFRHDFRHHVRFLNTLLENKSYKEAIQYLHDYDETTSVPADAAYCSNSAINIILNNYIHNMKDSGILPKVSVKAEEELFVQTSDICTILGNILENSIDGCRRQETGKRWIHICIMSDADKMAVAVDNTCGKTVRNNDGSFISTKTNRTGVGLSSVCVIAKKYGGNAWFEESDHVFSSSVVLYNCQ